MVVSGCEGSPPALGYGVVPPNERARAARDYDLTYNVERIVVRIAFGDLLVSALFLHLPRVSEGVASSSRDRNCAQPVLLHSDGLGQVTRLINIQPLHRCKLTRKNL